MVRFYFQKLVPVASMKNLALKGRQFSFIPGKPRESKDCFLTVLSPGLSQRFTQELCVEWTRESSCFPLGYFYQTSVFNEIVSQLVLSILCCIKL